MESECSDWRSGVAGTMARRAYGNCAACSQGLVRLVAHYASIKRLQMRKPSAGSGHPSGLG